MDGSALKYPGLTGSGGLIRNSSGSWVKGFARKIGITDNATAELWALRDGLTLYINLCLSPIEIELDDKEIVNFLATNVIISRDLCPLVDDCRELLQQIPQIKISHCYKEANFCVDALAKLGTNLAQEDCILFDIPPFVLLPLLDFDQSGLYCNRHCNVTLVT
jgi:ribonuclease HI